MKAISQGEQRLAPDSLCPQVKASRTSKLAIKEWRRRSRMKGRLFSAAPWPKFSGSRRLSERGA